MNRNQTKLLIKTTRIHTRTHRDYPSPMKPPRSDEDYRSTSPFRRRSHPPRPPRPTSKPDPSSAFLLASDWVGPTDDYVHVSSSSAEPRSFPYSVKQLCWEKAETVKGRDPTRWRRDPIGNLVFRKLVGCAGCLCHDYDHIVPYSKGGKSTLDNCQVLQASANRSKGNRTELSKAELIQKSRYCRVSGRDMDLIELSAYGDIKHSQESGGCFIQ